MTTARYVSAISAVILSVVMTVPVLAQREESPVSPLSAGRAAFDDGLFDLAAKRLGSYVSSVDKATDSDVEILELLLRSMYEQKRHADTQALLQTSQVQKIAGLRPGLIVYWQALTLFEMHRYEDSLAAIGSVADGAAAKVAPGRIERLRAWCYIKLDRRAEAVNSFSRFDKLHGDSDDAPANLLEWGQTLVDLGEYDAATNVLQRLQRFPATLPSVRNGLLTLAETYMALNDWDAAETNLAALGTSDAHPDLRAGAWHSLASIYRAKTNMTEAVVALKKGLATAKSFELRRTCGFELGGLLFEMDQVEEGTAVLKSLISAVPEDPRSGLAQIDLAEALLDHGRPAEALSEFVHYLETFTNRQGQAEAHFGKGWTLSKMERYAEAAAEFGRAHTLFVAPDRKVEALFKSGDSYFENAQYRLAAEIYGRIASNYPASDAASSALFQRGESLVRGGDHLAAEEVFLALVEMFPAHSLAEEALLRVAETREASGRLEETQGRWQQAQVRWRDSLTVYDQIMATFTNGAFYVDALHGRGLVRFRLFRAGPALADFQRIIEEFPESDLYEHAYYMKGMCHYRMFQDKEALRIWESFVEKFPESKWTPRVLFELGKYHYNQGVFEKAEEAFLAFLDAHRGHELADDALFWGGRSAMELNQYTRAQEHFSALIKRHPESEKVPEARLRQADALSQQGKLSAAILICDEIINKYPSSDMVLYAWVRKADFQLTLGGGDPKRYEEAIRSYSVVANDSSAATDVMMKAQYGIGRCLAGLNRINEARDHYHSNVMVRFMVDRKNGTWQSEAAKEWFTRASFNVADIEIGKENWREAVKILERVIEVDAPRAELAGERAKKIKAEHPLFFF